MPRRSLVQNLKLAALAGLWLAGPGMARSAESTRPYGLDSRPSSPAYLAMPDDASGRMPARLSQTGAFKDTRRLAANDSLIPYELNVAFWSDGATKKRWISVPEATTNSSGKIVFRPEGEWSFPAGTVFVKHFDLALDERNPETKRRLETRLLVCNATGGVYGVTYKWRADHSEAELLASDLDEAIPITTRSGSRTQIWHYPSRQECLVCHTEKAGGVLGVKTRQLNCDLRFPNGVTDNQLRAWNHAGLFSDTFAESDLPKFARLSRAEDSARSVEDRARSYLDANCAHCHRPGGTVAYFDARYDTPLPQQGLINGQILIDEGIDGARAISPADIWRSIIYKRASSLDGLKMPPLAHNVLDLESLALLRQWIDSLPGPPVVAPPVISPRGGNFSGPVEVTFNPAAPDVSIHYTLDGSSPGKADPIYQSPIRLTETAVVRARAFKAGSTKSIAVQEIFIIGG